MLDFCLNMFHSDEVVAIRLPLQWVCLPLSSPPHRHSIHVNFREPFDLDFDCEHTTAIERKEIN